MSAVACVVFTDFGLSQQVSQLITGFRIKQSEYRKAQRGPAQTPRPTVQLVSYKSKPYLFSFFCYRYFLLLKYTLSHSNHSDEDDLPEALAAISSQSSMGKSTSNSSLDKQVQPPIYPPVTPSLRLADLYYAQ